MPLVRLHETVGKVLLRCLAERVERRGLALIPLIEGRSVFLDVCEELGRDVFVWYLREVSSSVQSMSAACERMSAVGSASLYSTAPLQERTHRPYAAREQRATAHRRSKSCPYRMTGNGRDSQREDRRSLSSSLCMGPPCQRTGFSRKQRPGT